MAIRSFALTLILLLSASPAFSQDKTDSWASITDNALRKPGLIPIHVDGNKGKVWFELSQKAGDNKLARLIYAAGITGGLGSNPMGIDRSSGLTSHILILRRAGNRVFAEYENLDFRASGSGEEAIAVGNSFARSIVWSGEVAAEKDGKLLVDMTSFLMRDAGNLAGRFATSNQGSFKVDPKLSWLDTDEAHAFAGNLEFDAWLTYTSNQPGSELRATTPEPGKATLIIHSSFMALPESDYAERAWDERAGILGVNHVDMSAPLGSGVVKRLARRWRLEKTNPGPAPSRVKKPIVYYVDNSVPEPVRGALLDGARWWTEAFEAAGFIDAYRVEVLPEGVHPLDARYNVINWVHRATRGWSYGWGISDPRTGEMMKGFVLLGSLRVRQDIKIFEGLAGTAKTGSGDPDDPVEVALARIRQLSAHEVGHTLGFAHNMGASSYMGRASVMDYPAPDVRLTANGDMDFSNAYAVGMGEWDKWATRYLYEHFDDEEEGLHKLIAEANARGLRYVSDRDSRPVGSGHLHGALWDNGEDPVRALNEILTVRQAALDSFGERNIQSDESRWELQTKIVPVYLYHRYQLLAAAKALGGMEYEYSHRGDNRSAATIVDRAKSVAALEAILSGLTSDALDLSDDVLALLSPRGESNGDQQFLRESFGGNTGPAFDHMAAVRAASDLTLAIVLDPTRLNRMHQFASREKDVLGAKAALEHVSAALMPRKVKDLNLIEQTVAARYAAALVRLHGHSQTSIPVKGLARAELKALLSRTSGARDSFANELASLVSDYLDGKGNFPAPSAVKPAPIPPGSPIGAAQDCWHCDTADLYSGAISEK